MGNEVGPSNPALEKKPRVGMNEHEILRAFTYHPPKDDQADRYKDIRNAGWEMASMIDELCRVESREKSLALTKLRETIMWANAAIACNE